MSHTPERLALQRRIPTSSAPSGDPAADTSSLDGAPSRSRLVGRVTELNARHAATALRVALALVFVWFGVLKIAGVSPVRQLIAETLPFVDPAVSIPVLGWVEVVIGLALVLGPFPRITLLVLAGHLMGTFLSFMTASELMVQHGSPWQLTADGEFVVKNLILISAALVLVAVHGGRPTASGT